MCYNKLRMRNSSLIRLWSNTEHWRYKRIFVTFEKTTWSFVIIIWWFQIFILHCMNPSEKRKPKGQQPNGVDRELEFIELRKLMIPTRKYFIFSDCIYSWSKKVMHTLCFKLYFGINANIFNETLWASFRFILPNLLHTTIFSHGLALVFVLLQKKCVLWAHFGGWREKGWNMWKWNCHSIWTSDKNVMF